MKITVNVNKFQNSLLMMILILLFAIISVSDAIKCFECSSVEDNYCPEAMSSDDEGIVELKDCDATLYEGQYCIKTTGVTGGTGSWSIGSSELHCHVCDETKPNGDDFSCTDPDFLGPVESCRNIFDAQYCIKATGMLGGSLGTRRFCSSSDLGNYCDFIKRPGDQLEYRSCFYTCTGDGCNSAFNSRSPSILTVIATSVLATIIFPMFNRNGWNLYNILT